MGEGPTQGLLCSSSLALLWILVGGYHTAPVNEPPRRVWVVFRIQYSGFWVEDVASRSRFSI